MFSEVAHVAIAASSGVGDIQLHGIDVDLVKVGGSGVAAFTNPINHPTNASDIFFDPEIKSLGNFLSQRLIEHELLHALGLLDVTSTMIQSGRNIASFTVLSDGLNPLNTVQLSLDLQLYDVGGLQYIYGPKSVAPGDTPYDSFSGVSRMFSIYDTSGVDTIDAGSISDNALIDLRPGHFSSLGNNTSFTYEFVDE
ncbi:MAG: hypothetical protein EOP06_16325, partial [Proteobacteria bacterium]